MIAGFSGVRLTRTLGGFSRIFELIVGLGLRKIVQDCRGFSRMLVDLVGSLILEVSRI